MCGWKSSRLLLAVIALAAGCARREPPAASPAQVLRLSQRNEPADLDPALATLPDEFFVIRALSEGLLTPDPSGGAPLPAAAERYEISPDGLVYTFHLRADALWSNGEPVTAADFVASYRRLLTPATAAPKADLFYAVKNARSFATGAFTDFPAVGFRAADARTLAITLEKPTPRFLYYVASGPWIPVNPRTLEQHGRAWTQPGHFVGNGPFTLAEWRQHQRIVVRKNPRYHDAARVRIDEIDFIRFDNQDTEERAYRAGQVDLTMTVPQTKIETYTRERPAELHRAPLAETRFLSFNTQRPPLNDERVRRALSLAIDRERLVDRVLLGGQQPAGRLVPPALDDGEAGSPSGPEFQAATATTAGRSEVRPQLSEHTFAPDEARRLLAAAGFAGGKNFPSLELTGWTNPSALEAIQAMWRQELGLEIAVVVRDAKVHVAALRAGDYDIGFITAIPDVADPAAMLDNFTTRSPNNYPQFRDAAFDRACAAGDLAAAERRLLDAAAIAPLYFNSMNWLQAPRVHGWRTDALWTRFYQDVSLDGK
jgi:oligopeptide transport system substrate-binding protein